MSDVRTHIRFRVPADRDVGVHLYQPLSFFGPRETRTPEKYMVPAYLDQIDVEIAEQIKLSRKGKKWPVTPLRAYAETPYRPEIKGTVEMLRRLAEARDHTVVRNLSLDRAFDGFELWAEAELVAVPEEILEHFRAYHGRECAPKKLLLNFVEVPGQ